MAKKTDTQDVSIMNRWNGSIIFTAKLPEKATGSLIALALAAAIAGGANLRGANLGGADLYGADLCGADLRGADLCGADLYGANLYGANLGGANLRGANLGGANLRGANLGGADLYGADLYGADLYGADLRGANLCGADLCGADLRGANLGGADLYGADLRGADLRGADLCGAKNAEKAIAQTVITPEGTLIVWKKCRNNVIVKLRVPESARRSSASGRKCRAEFVEVLELSTGTEAISQHDGVTIYRAGDLVRCDQWCENRWDECAGGIHFYLTRLEAEAH